MTAQIINLSTYREPVRYRPEVGQMFRLNELYARVLMAQENGWCWCEVKSRDGAKHYTSWVHLSDLHPLRNDRDTRQTHSDAYVAAYVFARRKLRDVKTSFDRLNDRPKDRPNDRPSDTEEA